MSEPMFIIYRVPRKWSVTAMLDGMKMPYWYMASSRKKCVEYIRDQYPDAQIVQA